MLQLSALRYFDDLAGLLRNLRVTVENGGQVPIDEGVSQAAAMLRGLKTKNGKVMIIGNGGSSAIATHAQSDLSNAGGMRSSVFYETPMLTALSNDHGYETVFERSIEKWGDSGDILIAVSSSGKSENILRGVASARSKACKIVTFSGFKPDNPLRQTGDLNFYIPSESYGLVEVAHAAIVHFITDCVCR